MNTISMSDIKAIYNPGPGRHWFDRSTMRFFRTILPRKGYQSLDGTIYFVTSEQFIGSNGAHPRRYSVRKLTIETGTTEDEYKQHYTRADISTVGKFNEITTSREATAAAKMYALKGIV